MAAAAAQFGDVPHFLAVLAAVLAVIAALGNHARASRVRTFLCIGHGNLPVCLPPLLRGVRAFACRGRRRRPIGTRIRTNLTNNPLHHIHGTPERPAGGFSSRLHGRVLSGLFLRSRALRHIASCRNPARRTPFGVCFATPFAEDLMRYIAAWILGVPFSVIVLWYLVGHTACR